VTGLVAGRYRLGGLLGSGGSASVFVATDAETGTTVALKLLHPHLSGDVAARENLIREARAAGSVRHTNLVAVLDAGVDESGPEPVAWIALELAPGTSLAEHVDATGPLAVAETLAVARGVALALGAAHAAGLVHRDISPANIMVEPVDDAPLVPARVRVVDFGLADAAGRTSSDRAPGAPSPTVEGNANFMSPEQAVGADVDGRGDLYQLGAVLYFALTGRPPFPRGSAAETMRAHVSAPPPVASVLRRDVPRAVDRLVVTAMLKDPADRFQTAAELLAAVAGVDGAAKSAGAEDPRTRVLPAADETTRVAAVRARPEGAAPSAATVAVATAVETSDPPRRAAADASWAWRLCLALAVVGALIAWIASSATSTPRSEAGPPPSPSASAVTAAPPPRAPAAAGLVPVPGVVDGSLADARAALEAAGLAVGTVTEAASPSAAGWVTASAPAAGIGVRAGSVVDLVVASGSNLVPAVAGLQRDAAFAAVQQAGFAVLVTSVDDASAARGTVVATSPAGGEQLGLGKPVTIAVAAGPAPTASATPTATPTAEPSAERTG